MIRTLRFYFSYNKCLSALIHFYTSPGWNFTEDFEIKESTHLDPLIVLNVSSWVIPLTHVEWETQHLRILWGTVFLLITWLFILFLFSVFTLDFLDIFFLSTFYLITGKTMVPSIPRVPLT